VTAGHTARLEVRVVPEAGYPLELIPSVPLPASPPVTCSGCRLRLKGAVSAALEVVDRIKPEVVVGFGGYVSVPAYLAARRRHIPRGPRGQRPAGIANKRRPVHLPRGDELPAPRCATRSTPGSRSAG
jgi:UDP-N-acetylglucosamine--N-acetylmuramyl-(pentapeptide) pyrophosphoryl-undecaprenol N-acetylglucosamine transferase